jgi:hypothetical protein
MWMFVNAHVADKQDSSLEAKVLKSTKVRHVCAYR